MDSFESVVGSPQKKQYLNHGMVHGHKKANTLNLCWHAKALCCCLVLVPYKCILAEQGQQQPKPFIAVCTVGSISSIIAFQLAKIKCLEPSPNSSEIGQSIDLSISSNNTCESIIMLLTNE